LVEPILRNLRRDPDLRITDLAYLIGQLEGVDTGAVEFRAVPGTSKLIHTRDYPNGLAIVEIDPSAAGLFDAIRLGTVLPAIGTNLEGVTPSPANIRVPVVDGGSTPAAAEVLDLLSVGGFDVSAGVVAVDGLDVPAERSAIVFGPEDLVSAQVVQQHLPQLKIVEVGGLSGVAVVVTEDYRPQDPAEGLPPTGCIEVT
jgi:hypothetical protein